MGWPVHKSKTASRTNHVGYGFWLALAAAVIGVSLAFYPAAAKWFAREVQGAQIETYVRLSQNETAEETFQKALAYNQMSLPDVQGEYSSQLRVAGTDVLGRVKVQSVGIDLPIFHTANEAVLARGAGHMEQTHLPVGGQSTHAVLTAHTGLPTARMFDRLNQVGAGDLIEVEVLGHTLAYRVIETVVVDPVEGVRLIGPRPGADLLSLLTCTPYGVNTHRLVVTAKRVPEVFKVPLTNPLAGFPLWSVPYAVSLSLVGGLAAVTRRKFGAMNRAP